MPREKSLTTGIWKIVVFLVTINVLLVVMIVRETTGGYQPIILTGNSMQHENTSVSGIIDNGDSVIITRVQNKNEIKTYYAGKTENYAMFGEYGDVAAFRANQSHGKLVHRLVCYAILNFSKINVTADLPEMGIWGAAELVIPEYGYNKKDLTINFKIIYQKMLESKNVVREGYITKGDNFLAVDQETSIPIVSFSDIVGKVTAVIDNELSSRNPIDAILAFIVIFVSACLYVSWFVVRNSKKKSLFTHIPIAVLMIVVLFIIARDYLFLIHSSNVLGVSLPIYLLYPVFLAMVTLAMTVVFGWYRKKDYLHDNLFIPIFFLVLFLPYYFLFQAGTYTFGYSLITLSIAASIYHLHPDEYLKGLTSEELNKKFGTWMMLFFFEIMLFMLIVIVTLPFYFFFIAGWFAGTAYCVYRINQSRIVKNTFQ